MSEYKTLWIEAVLETKERDKILGEGKVVEEDRQQVNAQQLADEIARACNAADADGYEIISILPIDRGRDFNMASVAYSITDGVILTARKKK